MSLLITPETKVGALLEAHPGIEEVLIAWVPAFSKLRNPILRRTVAKVATLEQAAKIGGVSVRELVRKLREATGQSGPDAADPIETPAGETPAWVVPERVRYEFDADSMLERGEHPIGPIRRSLASLKDGELIRLTSSFRPAPLIDTMLRSGASVYSAETEPGRHVTYIEKGSAWYGTFFPKGSTPG